MTKAHYISYKLLGSQFIRHDDQWAYTTMITGQYKAYLLFYREIGFEGTLNPTRIPPDLNLPVWHKSKPLNRRQPTPWPKMPRINVRLHSGRGQPGWRGRSASCNTWGRTTKGKASESSTNDAENQSLPQPDQSASENVQQENVPSTVNEAEDNSEPHLINPDTHKIMMISIMTPNVTAIHLMKTTKKNKVIEIINTY